MYVPDEPLLTYIDRSHYISVANRPSEPNKATPKQEKKPKKEKKGEKKVDKPEKEAPVK